MKTKKCTRCTQILDESFFSPSQLKLNGSWCNPCGAEYKRLRRKNKTFPKATKECHTCGKDISEFRSHAKWCSPSCSAKGWHRNNPGKQREYLVKSLYGITNGMFLELLASQGNCCAICKTIPSMKGKQGQWNIDHCHDTGKVRGILCSQCNIGIGQLRDSVLLLKSAIIYLEK